VNPLHQWQHSPSVTHPAHCGRSRITPLLKGKVLWAGQIVETGAGGRIGTSAEGGSHADAQPPGAAASFQTVERLRAARGALRTVAAVRFRPGRDSSSPPKERRVS
jgi:hypothetical protein